MPQERTMVGGFQKVIVRRADHALITVVSDLED